MKGKLIVIDGTDGCGKTTQFEKLKERLAREEREFETFKFPQYENNYFGAIVRCFLDGKFGDPVKMNPYLSSILYAADRYESKKKLEKWLGENKIILLDRYVSANQIHQGGKMTDGRERETFLKWLDKIEHEIFGIPRPDIILYLEVSPETSQKITKNRTIKDLYDQDPEFQRMSREQSLRLIAEMNNWHRIVCEESGELLPIDTIHEKIWNSLLESGIIH